MEYHHLERLIITAKFSPCGKFRYQLSVINPHGKGSKTICTVMQNPSEADELKADKSIQFLEKLIFKKGYIIFKEVRKIIVVNQFAFIQKKGFTGTADQIGPENDHYIRESIEESDMVLIGWGKSNHYQERKDKVFQILASFKDKTLLETRKHPSRGFYKEFIRPFKVPFRVAD